MPLSYDNAKSDSGSRTFAQIIEGLDDGDRAELMKMLNDPDVHNTVIVEQLFEELDISIGEGAVRRWRNRNGIKRS